MLLVHNVPMFRVELSEEKQINAQKSRGEVQIKKCPGLLI